MVGKFLMERTRVISSL